MAVMSQRANFDAPLLCVVMPDVPTQLEAVVFRALRRDPAERYQSMAGLQYDLDDLESVEIPDYGAAQFARPRSGALPSPLVDAGIILAVFAF